ncbi:MAG: mercuric reductase [Candidatus Omnitrophica bacterium CG11_big_fil_rev_8_21_14_0_20_64_10]|nr:MAG: mercuric reductase [Candidatus Omnitrophica bacterium CG11_big_fil_rev_8_21_14_0_20_64_10]
MDENNRRLVANVHPPQWVNPEPSGRYNLVVIGAGTGGIVTAAGAAGLGAKVALIEKHLLGGDCLNYGCVPSKSVIRSGRAAADARGAGAFGVRVPAGTEVDFPAVMERMRRIRAHISRHDSAACLKEQGVDVYIGQARFSGPDTVEVDGKTLRFKKAVIATGARAAELPIPGLKEAGTLTNETVFSLTERPRRLACIGAGPIGCELAQAFRRLGSELFLFDAAPHVLIREDADAAEILQKVLMREGIRLILDSKILRIEKSPAEKIIHYQVGGKAESAVVDEILVGVGRAPNVEGLNLEGAGVAFDTKAGVKVNDHLQTSNARIYAVGDVCLAAKFTHTADASARIVIENALFPNLGFVGNKKLSALTIPWCTYTDPEIAHVGMYEEDARKAGIPAATFLRRFSEVDRALADGEEEGFVKIHVRKGTGRILGATVVARHAGEMMNEITLAIVRGIGLGALSSVIHPYPTQAEAIRQAADAYQTGHLTPGLKRFLERWFAWKRRG